MESPFLLQLVRSVFRAHLNMTCLDENNFPLIISRSLPKKFHNLTSDDLFETVPYFCDCLHQSPSGVGGARSPLPPEHFI